MKLPGKKILMIVAPESFRDEELFVPRRLFESLGAQVTVASTRTGRARGMLGGRATATRLIDHLRVDDFDAILIVGGDGAQEYLWPHNGLRALVQQAAASEKVIGAICLAPVVLARAGLLEGGEAALWRCPATLEELDRAGVRVADQDVLCAGRTITGSGPLVAERWAQAIAETVQTQK